MTLPATNKFATKGAAPATKAKPAKAKPRKFGPATDAKPRDPMLPAGSFRVRHIDAEELVHPVSKRISWRVQYSVGEDVYVALFFNTSAGVAEYQRYCIAMAGYTDLEEFKNFTASVAPDSDDSDDDFFASVIGDANAFSDYPLAGRLCDVRVTFGNEVKDKDTGEPTGDHFRNYKWTVVSDDDQDTAGKLEKVDA